MDYDSLNFFNSHRTEVAAIFGELNREIDHWLEKYLDAMPYTSAEDTDALNRVVLESDLDGTNLQFNIAANHRLTLKDIAKIWGASRNKDGGSIPGSYKLKLSEGRLWQHAPNGIFKTEHYRIIRHICNKLLGTGKEKLSTYEYKILAGKDSALSSGRYKDAISDCISDAMPELEGEGWGWDYHMTLAVIEIVFYIVGIIGAAFFLDWFWCTSSGSWFLGKFDSWTCGFFKLCLYRRRTGLFSGWFNSVFLSNACCEIRTNTNKRNYKSNK